ncbi:nucleotidyltransferase [Secundilactobacillus paracollinoides]|uniref:tRNA(Met) cytidine acetate ligase n=1 Tax=Secundilactobacillus paracollinoides TaxID=240427 RepID=A0A1B2J1B5_9LACO|nr:nucleotidyltransferase [Secundilactobacillus paracollinoides]ANZ62189.1 hypothetical protein AYR61_13105 [Secundilactobacillus paracollinoides]ANZ68136.1 hypothetical protein AYR63_13980 [Secundilactobacillus paracollinoides]
MRRPRAGSLFVKKGTVKTTNALGIIAEYNPFHNGHKYQLVTAKRRANADVTVAVMSGNWVQRGEPALLDKWQRTRLALENGLDLVVELPFEMAVQPAHLFAAGAVNYLHMLGCETLAFGAEHPDMDFAQLVANQPASQTAHFKQFDETYPTLFNDYLEQQTGIDLRASNDILGFTYVAANARLQTQMTILPIQRQTSDHQSETIGETTIASGAAIRKAFEKQDWADIAQVVPPTTLSALQTQPTVDWETFWPQLRYQLLLAAMPDLQRIYQMSEGIEYRLKQAALPATGFQDFLRRAKTKRFTYARLQRLCVYVLLQVTTVAPNTQPRYCRVLGFSHKGQAYLNEIKKALPVPVISKVTDDWINGPYRLDYQAGLLRQMMTGIDQDRLQHPVIL